MSARRVAVDVLVRVEEGAFAHIALPNALDRSDLGISDRAFVTAHVNGVLRLMRRLDALAEPVSGRPLPSLDAGVRAALRLGIHQLTTGTAPHAAVGETVAVVPRRARGFVNAVLRRVAELGPPWPTSPDIGVEESHPDWIVAELIESFGADDARRVLVADNEVPPVTLRLRPGVDADEVIAELGDADVGRGRVVPGALVVRHGGDPRQWECVRDGRAIPQDQSSQAVVEVLDPRAGERILDVAAAPGGKSAAIAALVGESGFVAALDRHVGRVRRVTDVARRCGVAVYALAADGCELALSPSARFDAVLVDAPCTGLGALRRRADARWRVGPDGPTELGALQRDLVVHAAHHVALGGRLVYSVCTWTRRETTDVADAVIETLAGFEPEPLGSPWRVRGVGGQLLASDGCDGMFAVRLRRVMDSDRREAP